MQAVPLSAVSARAERRPDDETFKPIGSVSLCLCLVALPGLLFRASANQGITSHTRQTTVA